MPELQVRISKLPFDVLDEWQTEALVEFERIRGVGLEVIERDVLNALPDQEEQELIGSATGVPEADIIDAGLEENLQRSTKTGALRKNVDPFKRQLEQAISDFERRLEFGAPLKPALGETTANLLLLNMPIEGGELKLQSGEARTAKLNGEGREEIVPLLAVVGVPTIDTLKLRDALTGKRSTQPVVIKHPKTTAFTIIEGAEEFLASRITSIPAMLMIVHRPRDAQALPVNTDVQVDRVPIETKAREVVRDVVYKLPSLLEPFGELARRFTEEDFTLLFWERLTPEEERVEQVAENKAQRRAQVWTKLFADAREAGKDNEEASRIARNDPRFRRAEDLEEAAIDRKIKVQEKWEERREEFREAARESIKLAEEDGIGEQFSIEDLSPHLIFREANKGQQVEEEDRSRGYPGGAYEIGERVEVRNAQGEWVPGVVNRIDGFDLRIKLESGSMRMISDPTKVRQITKLDLGQRAGLDTELEIRYNKGVETRIDIPKFNVTLPVGSNSLRIETELGPSTAEMNSTVLTVNEETWRRNLDAALRERDRLFAEAKIKTNNQSFRPNAPSDCVKEFFEIRGLPTQRINKASGKPACDKETLEAFVTMGDDLAPIVLEAREAQAKVSQLEKWEEFALAGEVQCNWNQLGTPHGRYSCDSPNLQNRIKEIRETIEAPQGFKFLSLDLGQAEYVTWASLSQDPTLIKAFEEGKDFHTQMFQEIKAAAPNLDIKGDERQAGKTINFALLYLMQPFVLAKKLGITEAEAREVIQAYEERAPIATAYKMRVIREIQKTGVSITKFGRVRELSEITTAKRGQLHQLTKTLWHHHNAGTAAEVLKIKQVKSWKAIRRAFSDEDARLAIQMHDEVIFMVRDEILEEATELAKAAFDEVIPGFLPFKVDVRTGRNWLQISK